MPEGHVIHRLAHTFNAEFRDKSLHITSPQGRFAQEAAIIDGSQLSHAEAFGKHLFLHFTADHPLHIVYIHLGLIGQIKFEDPAVTAGQVRLRIDNGALVGQLRGPQWCQLISEEEYDTQLKMVGQDPIRDDADPDSLWPSIHRSRRSIGSLMMDQKLFAGVGNIYRAETLFRQAISPFLPGNLLDRSEFDRLWNDLAALMADGVSAGRIDTVREEHTPEAMGREPRKDDHGGEVYVYRREGLPCYICQTPIAAKVMEGRNLFWCPACQPN